MGKRLEDANLGMWRRKERAHVGIGLVLGVLAGIALVILPGIAAPSDGRVTPAIGLLANLPASTRQFIPQGEASIPTLVIGLLFIVVPAQALSIYARRWALNRAKSFRAYEEDPNWANAGPE